MVASTSLFVQVNFKKCLAYLYYFCYRNSFDQCKQCRPWSYAALCRILPFSTLFSVWLSGAQDTNIKLLKDLTKEVPVTI